jgi:DNA-binding NarL/FixJ family response regulator
MDLIICFIDDSDFEHDLVHNMIAPSAPEITFLQAYTFKEAADILGENLPGLFLLDLWGQDKDIKKPYLTPKEELEKMVSGFNSLEQVYEGLEKCQERKTNEYLKRIFTIVDSWRSLFETVCDRIGQNRKYGLANLQDVRRYYPGVPAVFYTRKSLINDAVAMMEAGADGLFIKPTGREDSETRQVTKEYAPKLIEKLLGIVDLKIQNLSVYKDYYWTERTGKPVDVEDVISSWKEFINK